ncbi:hypothetical protein [Polaribacter sp. IC066]|uniref:hypothetical protein n=2 Tax=unclassified Polaribacter TaxID=196858 RepID=UPI0011BE2C96|nr:hypothetical protein [Polaribacter sp. IC066]TXD46011.1 hypothetical protein ES043_18510 [Polaribacter sp. IC063]
MTDKEMFEKSYNILKGKYRIIEIEKLNSIEKISFHDRAFALNVIRGVLKNAPLHTFNLYPYNYYWFRKVYWFFLKKRKNNKAQKNHPNKAELKSNSFKAFFTKFWWVFIIPLLAKIIFEVYFKNK